MTRRSPSRDLLTELESSGVPKNVIAKRLLLSPSSVSDLYAGRRALKHDEAVTLLGLIREVLRDRPLPVIGMAGAGNWAAAVTDPGNDFLNVPMQIGAGGQFVVEVIGESMNLLLPSGSYAVVEPDDRELYVGKLYLLQSADGEAAIKRYRADPARFEPVSDNPAFEPFGLHDLDFKVIGRVTAGLQRF